MVWEGVLVGLAGGAVVTLYRIALSYAEKALRLCIAVMQGNAMWILVWCAVLALILLVVCKLMLWEPYTAGSGIPQIDAEVIGKVNMPWHRVMAAKFAEGTLCSFAGLSLGREGPAVQLGGMSGKAISKLLKKGRGEERILVTCGAASGMAAAFHAPLTGVMFALEEIHKVFSAPLIISVMVSSVVADYFVSQVIDIQPVLSFPFVQDLPHSEYFVIVLMGVALGLLGSVHNLGMFAMNDLSSKIKTHVPYLRLAIPFALAPIVALNFPDLLCGGDAIVRFLEYYGTYPLGILVALLVGKYLYTTVCFGSGAPGGTLFPLVVMGALSGAIFGTIVMHATGLDDAYMANFIVLGIAGLFAGVVRAPVTAIVLAFELTGSFDALLSVSIVSILAYVTANLLRVDPFYEHLLANLLGVDADDEEINGQDGDKVLRSFQVEVGSYFEGKSLQEIPWPHSCLVVTVERCGAEFVPNGDTTLQALDKLLVIMDSNLEDDSEETIATFCHGTVGYGGR